MVKAWLRERERERERGGEGSGEQCQVSDWQDWHPVTNHSLPLYAVACWTSDGGGMRDALESKMKRTSSAQSLCLHYCVWWG